MKRPRSWEGLKLGGGAVALIAIGLYVASRFVSPAPPNSIRIAAGPLGGAYEIFAVGYAKSLEKHGIALEVVKTRGAIENLAMLRAGDVDLALVQTGLADPLEDGSIRSLGSLFHEPLWLFVRNDIRVNRISQLDGMRLEVGKVGSGTRALAAHILELNDVTETSATWLSLGASERLDALGEQRPDAIFAVGSVMSPSVRELLADPRLRLQGIDRAEAYTRVDHSISKVVLPEGVIDFALNVPSEDTVLISAMGELLIAEDLHPALIDVVLQSAADVHQRGDIFSEPGDMPSPRYIDVPLSPEAERYFEHGPPFLQRYLPFWAATQIDRLKVMLIPIVALLFPLVRIFPPTYRWRVRSRIYRWYGELRGADPVPGVSLDARAVDERIEAVSRIEHEVAQLPTPPSYAAELYALRLHVAFVKERLVARRETIVG